MKPYGANKSKRTKQYSESDIFFSSSLPYFTFNQLSYEFSISLETTILREIKNIKRYS